MYEILNVSSDQGMKLPADTNRGWRPVLEMIYD